MSSRGVRDRRGTPYEDGSSSMEPLLCQGMVDAQSWQGKHYLESCALRLRMSPADAMRDHKSYCDLRDLRPLMVRKRFTPRDIYSFRHEVSLRTFAACRQASAEAK